MAHAGAGKAAAAKKAVPARRKQRKVRPKAALKRKLSYKCDGALYKKPCPEP